MQIDPLGGAGLNDFEREFAAVLDEWDPIGVYGDPALSVPPGEYADLVRPVLARLQRGVSAADLAFALRDVMAEDYGIEIREAEAQAEADRIFLWYLEKQG